MTDELIEIPSYVDSIDAIAKVFVFLRLNWESSTNWDGRSTAKYYNFGQDIVGEGKSLAIALCKLLVAISPEPIKPAPKEEKPVESNVVEASFQ